MFNSSHTKQRIILFHAPIYGKAPSLYRVEFRHYAYPISGQPVMSDTIMIYLLCKMIESLYVYWHWPEFGELTHVLSGQYVFLRVKKQFDITVFNGHFYGKLMWK